VSVQVGLAQAPPAGAAAQIRATVRSRRERSDIAQFGEQVQAALASTGNDKGYWGLLITDADTGEVLYSLNAGRYFMPASNAKLFTTAMALATLGPDFRIRTPIPPGAWKETWCWSAGAMPIFPTASFRLWIAPSTTARRRKPWRI
jgi:D-alanyl-D-alanine carboxypeptidase